MKCKEGPILMTPENAQKCHDGTKIQTRRLNGLEEINIAPAVWAVTELSNGSFVFTKTPAVKHGSRAIECPYGVVGDRLWVREATAYCLRCGRAIFKGQHIGHCPCCDKSCADLKWSPSIYMPRLACRTVLEITDIRVERLQEISEEDALAEGVMVRPDAEIAARVAGHPETGARMEFYALWESIHGIGSWSLNPWVWVISFKKVNDAKSATI